MAKRHVDQECLHALTVEHSRGGRHRPVCLCGWIGTWRVIEDHARTDWADHIGEVADSVREAARLGAPIVARRFAELRHRPVV